MSANVEHKALKGCQPPDPNVRIWRYVDLLKLLAFLQTRRLHFSRADKFDDRFEGSLTSLNVADRKRLLKHAFKHDQTKAQHIAGTWRDITRNAVRGAYVNCWHASETESQAMWKLYGTSTGSVAIQSTYRKLRDVLPSHLCIGERGNQNEAWRSEVYLGMVQYRDYRSVEESIPEGNLLYPFMSKRKELQHEQEVRAIALFGQALAAGSSDGSRMLNRVSMPEGLRAEVDIDRLVETVCVQPGTPPWVKRAIEDLIRKCGWNVEVVPSEIDATPLY